MAKFEFSRIIISVLIIYIVIRSLLTQYMYFQSNENASFYLPKIHEPLVKQRGSNTSVAEEWERVIFSFLGTAPQDAFSRNAILKAYNENEMNVRDYSVLVNISQNGNVSITEDFGGKVNTRLSSVHYIINKIVLTRLPALHLSKNGVLFLVMVRDGAHSNVAVFGTARHWKHMTNLIPIPLGNDRGLHQGWANPLENWDKYIKDNVVDKRVRFPWKEKKAKAVFRGAFRMQTFVLGSCNVANGRHCKRAKHWTEVNRGALYQHGINNSDILDIGFVSVQGKNDKDQRDIEGAPRTVERMPHDYYQSFKMIINVGCNQDWAERLRVLLYTGSAVVIHEAETEEFFTPLLVPWMHYVPTDIMFSDLEHNVKKALQNDELLQNIVRNADKFTKRYLSEASIELYWEIAIREFGKHQK